MKKRLIIAGVLALAVVLASGAYFVLNTRLGVHFALDVLGGGDPPPDHDPQAGPLVLTGTLAPVQTIELPAHIQQPSGIQHRGDRVYLSTDQTELFVGDVALSSWSDKTDLVGGPLLLKQGSLEAIEFADDTVFAIGEFGVIRAWVRVGDGWERVDDVALPAGIAEMEFSGITQFDGRRFATSEERPVLVDLDTGTVHELDGGDRLKPGADLGALQLSGLANENGDLYLLTETHSSILVVDPADYSVEAVWGITPGAVADLAVRDGKAYVVVDHNYLDEKPPVYVYELPRTPAPDPEPED
ncbi:MAG: hypothetical protein AAGI54_09730 [Planctomycetota bacterium]